MGQLIPGLEIAHVRFWLIATIPRLFGHDNLFQARLESGAKKSTSGVNGGIACLKLLGDPHHVWDMYR